MSDTNEPTIRDHFALAALNGLLCSDADSEGRGVWDVTDSGTVKFRTQFAPAYYSALAYRLADAMLAERAKSTENVVPTAGDRPTDVIPMAGLVRLVSETDA